MLFVDALTDRAVALLLYGIPSRAGLPLAVPDEISGSVLRCKPGIAQGLLDVYRHGGAVRRDAPLPLQLGTDELIQLTALRWIAGDDDRTSRALGVVMRDGGKAMLGAGVLVELRGRAYACCGWSEVHRGCLADLVRKPGSRRCGVVGIDSRVVRRMRYRDISETGVDERAGRVGIDVDQDAPLGESLGAVRGHGIAVIEGSYLRWIERNSTAIFPGELDVIFRSSSFTMFPRSRLSKPRSLFLAVNWMRSPVANSRVTFL